MTERVTKIENLKYLSTEKKLPKKVWWKKLNLSQFDLAEIQECLEHMEKIETLAGIYYIRDLVLLYIMYIVGSPRAFVQNQVPYQCLF
jgi:hypothetical protein